MCVCVCAYKALTVHFLGVLSNVCRPMIVNYLMEKIERELFVLIEETQCLLMFL